MPLRHTPSSYALMLRCYLQVVGTRTPSVFYASNGQSEIVAICLLVTEDSDSMTWMMEAFNKHSADREHVQVVMADKDIVGERDVIKQQLPNAAIQICLFHTLRSLRRETTCEKIIRSEIPLLGNGAENAIENHYSDLHAEFVKKCSKGGRVILG